MASPATDRASLEEAYRHCWAVTRQRAKNFYFAFLSLPRRHRQAIYAVYAFCRGCDDYSDDDLPPERRVELLEDYRRRLHACFAGEPSGPVFLALHDVVQRYRVSKEYFDEIISGVQMDLTIRRYATFQDLYTYCYRVASVVGLVCIEIFGRSDPQAKQHAIDLGLAMQLVNIMRDIQEDAGRDRVYLPLDELARFGYRESDLFRGIVNEQFVALMGFQAQRAREYFRRGAQLVPLMPARSRPCVATLRALYSRLLDRMESSGWNVFSERFRLSTREKLWLAGRIWTGTMLKGALPRSW